MNYENRFVLFLDILGFKKIIESTYDKEKDVSEQIGKLYNALKTIKKANNRVSGSKRITQFSDSIVVSFSDVEHHEFTYLLDDISFMLFLLAFEGIVCRGAIAYGKFYHDDQYLFGPALVEAYETESKAATYPRVIVDKSVVNIFKIKRKVKPKLRSFKRSYLNNFLIEDFDDKLYIDYFFNPITFAGSYDIYLNYLAKLREVISLGLSKARSPDVKVKYGWMKQKFNAALSKVNENKTSFETTNQQRDQLARIKSFE